MMRKTIIGIFVFCFLALIGAIYTLAPMVVDEAIVVNSEKLALRWAEGLQREFDLPGKLIKAELEKNVRPLRLLSIGINPEIDEVDRLSLFDPSLFRDQKGLGYVKSYTVFTRFGDRFLSGGKQISSSVAEGPYKAQFDKTKFTQTIQTNQYTYANSGELESLYHGVKSGHPLKNHVITVMIPLTKGHRISGIVKVEIIPTSVLDYIEIMVQRVAAISAILLGLLSLFVLSVLTRWNIERTRAARAAEYLAKYDPLTGALNRRTIQDFMNSYKTGTQTQPFTLWAFDVDNFKKINDTYGHPVGDEVLRKMATRIRASMPPNTIFARISGDEFVAIIQQPLNEDQIRKISDTITRQTKEPIFIKSKKLISTSSCGIASFPTDSSEPHQIPIFADMALYHTKENQKGEWHRFNKQINEQWSRERLLHMELEKAIKNKSLQLYFQPQIDVSYGEVIGMEALLRWQHKELGFISPTEFIDIAEKHNLVVDIDCFVLNKACEIAKTWDDKIKVGVNISPIHFEKGNLVASVEQALKTSGLPANRLEIEITENVLLKKATDVKNTFDKLKEIGVSISLDDFGTGYSNLSYLSQMPINRLKIDRSFIAKIHKSPASRTIVKALVFISRELDIEVLAEGVETYAELQMLTELNCQVIQGYLLGKPSPDPFNELEPDLITQRYALAEMLAQPSDLDDRQDGLSAA